MNYSPTDPFFLILERIFGASQGTHPFTIISLIALGTLLLAAWCITNLICSGRKGLIISVLSQVIPGIAAIVAWLILTRHVAPLIEAEGLRALTVVGGTLLAGIFASRIVSKKLLGISFSGALVSNILTYACVAAAILLGGSLVRDMDSNLADLSQKQHLRDENTLSIIGSDPSQSFRGRP